jgi:hypothetical protein
LGSEAARGARVSSDVNTSLLLEVCHTELNEAVVEVLTTEMGVAVGGLDFEDTILNG